MKTTRDYTRLNHLVIAEEVRRTAHTRRALAMLKQLYPVGCTIRVKRGRGFWMGTVTGYVFTGEEIVYQTATGRSHQAGINAYVPLPVVIGDTP